MFAKETINYANILLAVGSIVLIGLIIQRRAIRAFGFLVALLGTRIVMSIITVVLLFHRKDLEIPLQVSYNVFFYSHWVTAVLELILQFLIIYSVYRTAMKPMEGLQEIGKMVFRWATVVSLVLSAVVVLGPHEAGTDYFSVLLAQAQQGVSVLTICLLVFVTFAARPLGLTFRSRHFGTLLGLGILSTSSLVIAAWFASPNSTSLYAPQYAVAAVVPIFSILLWTGYFLAPEPARKLITLPTTSPYFHWNEISKALGDDPGEVAVAGFAPSMFAAAELTAIAAANEAARARELGQTASMGQPLIAAAR